MIGVIDVGGGLRGSYGAGVFDWCMEYGIEFDYGIGVSAGSANVASYLGHQKGRNYVFYMDYMSRPQYMGFHSLLKTGSYVGLEYIYGDLSDSWGAYPLNWKGILDNPAEYRIVATNANTGKPVYFDKTSMKQDDYCAIKASCNVPIVDRPFYVDGVPYYDGGMSDPIPYKKALADGCDRLVVILTRPKDEIRKADKDEKFAKLLEKKFPEAARSLRTRSLVYNDQKAELIEMEKQGNVLIIAPDSIGHMRTLNKEKNDIRELYIKGYRDARAIRDFLKK